MKKIFGALLFGGILVLCVVFFMNSRHTSQIKNSSATIITNDQKNQMTPSAENKNWKDIPGLYAEIQTVKGTIVTSLFYQKAPVTVANFVGLAEGKIKNNSKGDGVPFYDGLTFHRAIHSPQPFMIQGGDPQGNGLGGPGYTFGDEFDLTSKFDKPGMLAMANAGPATNGSQFFITEVATDWLNNKHTIFGEVVEGFPLVSQIQNGDGITKVIIVRVGSDAKAFDAVAIWAKKDQLLEKKQAELGAQKAEATKDLTISAGDLVKRRYPNAQKTASGLYYVVEKEGTGTQGVLGNTVSVHYTGTLANGTQFDSSYDHGRPLDFGLGQHQVITGMDEGVALMKVGSKYTFIIPSSLGYRDSSVGPIPPNATLIFEVELLAVK